MKKIIAGCALLASFAAVATTVESANTFGVLKVTDASTTELIIAVPWAAVGNGDIKVTDLVLPTGLANGDKLYWYSTAEKNFKSWVISEGAWAANNVTLFNEQPALETTLNDTVARGEALVLVRTAPGTNKDIYLSGQYTDSTSVVAIACPTPEDKAARPNHLTYTLIAPSAPAEVNLNAAIYYSDEGCTVAVDYKNSDFNGDKIQLSDGTEYSHDSDGWYKWGDKQGNYGPKNKSYTSVIPQGQGAWYKRNGTSPLYIKW